MVTARVYTARTFNPYARIEEARQHTAGRLMFIIKKGQDQSLEPDDLKSYFSLKNHSIYIAGQLTPHPRKKEFRLLTSTKVTAHHRGEQPRVVQP